MTAPFLLSVSSILCARRFAHIQDLDTGSTCLAFEMGQGLRLQNRDALWLAISRLIEERVGLLQSAANVRHWLLTIGEISAMPALLLFDLQNAPITPRRNLLSEQAALQYSAAKGGGACVLFFKIMGTFHTCALVHLKNCHVLACLLHASNCGATRIAMC